MNTKLIAMSAAVLMAEAITGAAQAQDRFEAGNQGYRGGYSTFGGYYDTFGGYGGYNSYSGYRRYEGSFAPTTSFFSIPLTGPSTNQAVVVRDRCAGPRSRAEQTGKRQDLARLEACRRGS